MSFCLRRHGLPGIATGPRVLGVALDQAALLQHPAEAFGDALDQRLQIDRAMPGRSESDQASGAATEIPPVFFGIVCTAQVRGP